MTPELPRRIERINYLLVGVVAAVGAVFFSTPHSLGLLVGSLISALHFTGLRWIVEKLRNVGRERRIGFGVLLVPHLLVTMGAIILALSYLPISGGAVLVGFSIFIVSIVAGTILDLTSATAEQHEDESAS